jgi:hypothetical protein
MTGTQCMSCKHFNWQVPRTCAAFPAGIPSEIFYNRVNHDTPYSGDNGIQYEISEEFKASRLKYGVPLPGSSASAE